MALFFPAKSTQDKACKQVQTDGQSLKQGIFCCPQYLPYTEYPSLFSSFTLEIHSNASTTVSVYFLFGFGLKERIETFIF